MKNIIYTLIAVAILFSGCKKEGCMDSTATNYNPDAEKDDGSCYTLGCMDSVATNYDPLATVNNYDSPCTYLEIGDSYQGGQIFYLSSSGPGNTPHGLIVQTNAIGNQMLPWGCSGALIGTSSDIGTGAQNTIDIISGCIDPGIAAKSAANPMVSGGYSDWYLPSHAELLKLHQARHQIWGLNKDCDTPFGIPGVYYWSSSEASNNRAYCVNFSDMYVGGMYECITTQDHSKSSLNMVVAVRNF